MAIPFRLTRFVHGKYRVVGDKTLRPEGRSGEKGKIIKAGVETADKLIEVKKATEKG